MLSPDYIRNMARRLRRIAQDMEDDVIAAIVAALLTLLDGEVTSELVVSERISQIVEQYQVLGIMEIRNIFRDALQDSLTADAKAMIEATEVEQEPTQEPTRTPEPTPERPQRQEPIQPEPQREVEPVEPLEPTTPTQPKEIRQEDIDAWLKRLMGGSGKTIDPYIRDVVQHYYTVTEGEWINLTETEAYSGNEAYVNAVDQAAIDVSNGKSSQEAVDEALDKLDQQGIDVVTNPETGHTDHVDVAVERNIRTSVTRMTGDITLENCRRNGITLVLVSAHYGARPTHAVWQGKVYSLIGDTDKYKDFFRETEYGQMLGLCGINCRHSFSPFVEGMHNPYEGKEDEYNDPKRYDDEQKQRALERKIRKLRRMKRTIDAEYKANKTPELKEKKQRIAQELREAIAEYEAFCAEHDFRPLWERTRD